MAPEEGLEPTTLRLTALPAASPLVPGRPRKSPPEPEATCPRPRFSPLVPAGPQESVSN